MAKQPETEVPSVPLTPLEEQRSRLLNLLFGSDVPQVLEGQLLRTADVAVLFEVSERTVSEWARKGQIPSVRTPGGHRRYPADAIRWHIESSREDPSGTRPGILGPTISVTEIDILRRSATA